MKVRRLVIIVNMVIIMPKKREISGIDHISSKLFYNENHNIALLLPLYIAQGLVLFLKSGVRKRRPRWQPIEKARMENQTNHAAAGARRQAVPGREITIILSFAMEPISKPSARRMLGIPVTCSEWAANAPAVGGPR
jgi:hypothetical protein